MRVLVISRGDFVHLSPFLSAMKDRGWDVHFAALSPWNYPLDGVSLHRCFAIDIRALKPLSYAYGAWKIRQLRRRLCPDLVWGHYVSSAGTVAWASGARDYALTIHGSDVLDVMKRPQGRFALVRALKGAGQVHTVSQQTADAAVTLGVSETQIRAIPFGIDVDSIPFRPVEIKSPIKMICTRSLQYSIYDIPTLIRATAVLHRQGIPITLTLCGRGKLRPDLEQLAKDQGVASQVVFHGGYQPEELVELLHDHQVYLSASLSDGASLSLMEAMAAGLYPVLSDIAANRHWITDERGSFFAPGDHEGLAEQILQLHRQEKDVVEAVKENRSFVEKNGNRQTAMNEVLDFVTADIRASDTISAAIANEKIRQSDN